jgi:hypothetical protein
MSDKEELLRHQLAALAYRTQKALQEAPPDFGGFSVGCGVRTPHELLNHMTNLVAYTISALRGQDMRAIAEAHDFSEEMMRFHALLGDLSGLLAEISLEREDLAERLLQGPLSDAMTHVGQLALLRRLAASPITAENYFRAPIRRDNVTADQPIAGLD